MRNFTKYAYTALKAVLFTGISVCALTACSSDDDDPETPSTQKDAVVTEEMIQHRNLIAFVSSLTNPSIDDSSNVVTLRYGQLLDEAQPGVYSMGVENYNEAYELVEGFGIPMTSSGNAYVMDFGKYGKATLNRNTNGGSLLATLDLQLDTLKSISQLRFLEQSAMPESNAAVAFKRGDIVRYNNDKSKTYVCIAQQSGSSPCVLLRYYGGSGTLKVSDMDYTYGYYVPDEGFAFQKVTNLSGTILSSVGVKALQKYLKEDKTGWNSALTRYAANTSLTTCFLHFYYDWGYYRIEKNTPTTLSEVATGVESGYWLTQYAHTCFFLSSTLSGTFEAYKADGSHYYYTLDYSSESNDGIHTEQGNPYYFGLNAILLEDYTLNSSDSKWETIQ